MVEIAQVLRILALEECVNVGPMTFVPDRRILALEEHVNVGPMTLVPIAKYVHPQAVKVCIWEWPHNIVAIVLFPNYFIKVSI